MDVDILLLSRDDGPLRPDVLAGIEAQRGVRVHLHRLIGDRRPDDPHRFATIARARNTGRAVGSSPYVLLLDDDVVLGLRCAATLAEGLGRRPVFAALAADSANEMRTGLEHWDYPHHVSMAAAMFRRERLRQVTFRWEDGKCECRCCCEDLRREGFGIGYLREAEAWHRPSSLRAAAPAGPPSVARPPADVPALPGRVLSTFNRRHQRLFRRRFLGSFRRAGNAEAVTAVAAGLYPSEHRALAATEGVEVFPIPDDAHPSKSRLRNFRRVLECWPDQTPVAYWDAGDVVFQARVAPLWDLVRAHPDRLLVVEEVSTFRHAGAALAWLETIRDESVRRRALDLLIDRRVLNGGFAAGTARTMRRYLAAADALESGPLVGSTDFGDQTAMNVHLRSNPDDYLVIPSSWNYVLVHLPGGSYRVRPDGWTDRLDGQPLHVVHGAAGTLRDWDLVHLTS
ncbi:hypothetical protein OJF2_78960 (plasmid) [Aquisphaera giovannonii]|uniref:Uncharacterized protein n=1 Tax=Aquisphaera giovannonii TaxID=406548 RepID=A0A5B9WH73_9BACT|nr:glycosyltransferase family 2 protein [Aquisphaera giovannonii]QEH39281.1 hypothetical protein OJF2_78960 [Aquisphaera giovannonii]